MASASTNYAGVGSRFLAVIVDAIIIGILNFIITLGFQAAQAESLGTLVGIVVAWGYYIYFIGSRGQTLGKMALGIKVVKLNTGTHPDYLYAFLREIVGKMLSGLVLLLGYLWAFWDPKRQTWHDKIANTVVVKV